MAAVLPSWDAGVGGEDAAGERHQLARGRGCGEGSSCDIAHLCASMLKQPYKPNPRLIAAEAGGVVTVGRKTRQSSPNSSCFVLIPLITVSVEP